MYHVIINVIVFFKRKYFIDPKWFYYVPTTYVFRIILYYQNRTIVDQVTNPNPNIVKMECDWDAYLIKIGL